MIAAKTLLGGYPCQLAHNGTKKCTKSVEPNPHSSQLRENENECVNDVTPGQD